MSCNEITIPVLIDVATSSHSSGRHVIHQKGSSTTTVREEDSGHAGERLVKIQLQDATTSTKHVGFRLDKSCQTAQNGEKGKFTKWKTF